MSRAVAYVRAEADCIFVPFILDHGAIAALVAIGVRQRSASGGLAIRTQAAFISSARQLRESQVKAVGWAMLHCSHFHILQSHGVR